MPNNVNINVEHIIAKIDNDYNPDNSDWIPRIAPWCIDALNQLKLLRKIPKKRQLTVVNKIAKSKCCLIEDELKVYDSDGCEVPLAKSICYGCKDDVAQSSTGSDDDNQSILNYDKVKDCNTNGSHTREILNTENKECIPNVYTTYTGDRDETKRDITHNSCYGAPRRGKLDHNYVLANGNTIELNFDDTCITVVNNEIETKYSDVYHCEVPVIPNNGILIEAITYYCLYKMLCRGWRHPAFTLNASQYGTNPYYEWISRMDKAKTSVLLDEQTDSGKEWQAMFYNFTFPK